MSVLNLVSAQEIKNKSDYLNAFVICDIRTPQEFAREHIPASINTPLDQLESFDFTKFKNKTILFLCRSGIRTRNAMPLLYAKNIPAACCLEGGLESWKAAGLSVVKDTKVPIDIMRQVQIIAGSLILLGLLGFFFVSKYFLLLPLIVGMGQVISGLTGFCGMARLLIHLPYNANCVK